LSFASDLALVVAIGVSTAADLLSVGAFVGTAVANSTAVGTIVGAEDFTESGADADDIGAAVGEAPED